MPKVIDFGVKNQVVALSNRCSKASIQKAQKLNSSKQLAAK
jgi:hypothetical protein